MGKLLTGSTLLISGLIVHFGIMITTTIILTEFMDFLEPGDVLRETWLYYPSLYVISVILMVVGVALLIWGMLSTFKNRPNTNE
ncbi:hypothetical protein DH09_00030 (plasmid) [Bacillaceae bacterium JMAK1]|nr:hypothetical protein DH09_00030 [Bacillaceae bacterium JMAK1]